MRGAGRCGWLVMVLLAGCVGRIQNQPRGDGGATDVRTDVVGDRGIDTPVDHVVTTDVTEAEAGCGAGRVACAGACVDVTSDPANCGACGVACATGTTCMGGSCRPLCASGQTLCGTPPRCVTLASDPANCGACGTACATAQVCSAGACAATCSGTMCGAACTDLQTDPSHCGDCATGCAAGQQCVAGACQCASGLVACGGACVDTQTDPMNCGGCAIACASGLLCRASACACASGTLCGSACVDTSSDPVNCGACGVRCAPSQTCVGGACIAVDAGTQDVTDTANDLAVIDAADAMDVIDAGDAFDATDATDANDVLDATDARDASDVFDAGALDVPALSPIAQIAPEDTMFMTNVLETSIVPRALWLGSNWRVFWAKRTQSCTWPDGSAFSSCTTIGTYLMATDIDVAGNVLAPPHTILTFTTSYQRGFDVMQLPAGYEISWIESNPANSILPNVHYARLDASLNVASDNSFGIEDDYGSSRTYVAGDGTTDALVWEVQNPHQTVHFAPINAGDTLGSEVLVTFPYFSHQIEGSLAWDGTQFGWVFESDRYALSDGGSVSGTGGPVEIFLSRLAPSGTFLGTTLLSEGIEQGLEFISKPTLVPQPGGGFVAAWTADPNGVGHDIAAAFVASDGTKVGSNHMVTNDGDTTSEATPAIVYDAASSTYVVSYGFVPGNATPTGSVYLGAGDLAMGIDTVRMDATGALVGSPSTVLPAPPGCATGYGYPTPMAWCYHPENVAVPDTIKQTLVLGAGGAAHTSWSSDVWVLETSPTGQQSGSPRTIVFGRESQP